MHKARPGIQSVEVGFALLDAFARSAGPLILRDLAAAAGMSAAKAHSYLGSFQRLALDPQWGGVIATATATATALLASARRLSADLGHKD